MEKLKSPTQLQQEKLFALLKCLNKELYEHLDPNLRTLYIRLTGDNFRGSAKFPTEQISFLLLNNIGMLHSPYSQFIASLWRGSESRLNVKIHVSEHYNEIKELLDNGLIVDKNGSTEKFDVLPIMCADLCFGKEVIEKCSCTSIYGSFYYKKDVSNWERI